MGWGKSSFTVPVGPLADVEKAGAGGQDIAQLLQHVLGKALHPLGGAAHADKPHITEHAGEVVATRAQGQVVQHVLLHLLQQENFTWAHRFLANKLLVEKVSLSLSPLLYIEFSSTLDEPKPPPLPSPSPPPSPLRTTVCKN